MISCSEIPWTSHALPRPELLPAETLITLDAGDLLEYAYSLQRETVALRETLQESCALNASLTRQVRRALTVIHELRHRTRWAA